MRKLILFSIALGLSIPTYSFAEKSSVKKNKLGHSKSTDHVIASQITIRGKVTGPNGPISGATVSVVGGTTVSTDDEGNYTITAANGATLRFSNIGFVSRTIVVTSNTINVSLEEDKGNLEEVVVVGYGALKQRNVTGAVSVVDVEKTIGSRPIPDAARGLQGAVPGLTITVPSGEVGSNPLIRIRGQVGSIAGSSNPLILVDNVEVPSIQMVNPNDIEAISVLKDASSTSIYGAKAAFGVILITTKSGAKTESNNFNYSSNLSMQSPFKEIELAGLDGLEYTLEANENRGNSGSVGTFWRVNRESYEKAKEWEKLYGGKVKSTDPVVYNRDWYFGNDGFKYGLRIYDPIDVMVKQNPLSHIHNIGMLGKRGATDYSLSAGYLGQQGMMKPAPKDDFTRYTTNLKVSSEINKVLTLRGSAMYSDATKRYPNAAHGFGSDPWLYIYRWSRIYPIGVQEHGEQMRDPYWDTKNAHTATRRERFLNLNFGSTINLASNWDIKADYTYTSDNNGNFVSQPTFAGRTTWTAPIPLLDQNGLPVYVDEQGLVVDSGGVPAYQFPWQEYVAQISTYVDQSSYNAERHTFNAFSTYNLDIAEDHNFKFLVGTNIVSYKWRNHWSRKTNLLMDDRPEFDFAIGTNPTSGGGANWDSQAGFFGRLNYAYKDKYLLEASARYDGTSKFPKHLKWRWFPSASAGWIVSSERFMEALNPVLSFAKLRASYGMIGDQSVSNSLYIPTMSASASTWLDNTTNRSYVISTPGAVSGDIRWQDIEHLNFGTDLRFFKNNLGITVDWFQRYTKNMIIPGRTLPATYGTSSPQGNFGNLRTRGWEFAVDYNLQFNNGLRLNLGANLGDAVTITTKGADWNTPWENRLIDNTFTTGKRYGDIYGYVTDRLFQKEDFVYDDQGNNVQIRIIDAYGNSRLTNKLVGDNPVYQTYFETVPGILEINPGDVKFVDVNGDGHITPGNSTFGNPGDRVVIGNSTPRYEFGFRLGAEFKGFDFAVFVQGIGKRSIWGSGQLAIPGYHTTDGAMPQAIAGNFWKEDRTDAFYPRAWQLGGADEDFTMRKQSRYMLDMSYTKIKNITLGYSIPKRMMERANLNRARLYLSFENYFLFDNLRGLPIDPEAISGYSILRTDGNYNLGRTGTGNPPFKSASLGLQIDF